MVERGCGNGRGAAGARSGSEANQDYLREIGAIPVRYRQGVGDRVRAAAGGRVDAVFDVAGKTAIEELIRLVSQPFQVLSITNFTAGQAGAQVTGGDADSNRTRALAGQSRPGDPHGRAGYSMSRLANRSDDSPAAAPSVRRPRQWWHRLENTTLHLRHTYWMICTH